jgi:synaptobrevin family protein YKT6
MKILSLSIWNKEAEKGVELMSIHDVSQFGYFQRSSVSEFLKFTAQFLADRTAPGERKSVKEREYICHILVKSDKIGGVLICDEEYPQRVAYSFILKSLDDFVKKHPKYTWRNVPFPEVPEIKQQFDLFQDPRQADSITQIQGDLDETKVILYNTIEQVLERGEKLDDIVAKSENLSLTSKQFYKTAKSTNSCCTIL